MEEIARTPREHNRFYGQNAAASKIAAMGAARPNGLLLYGDKGVGKATLAYRVARAYLGASRAGNVEDGDAAFSFSPHDDVFVRVAAGSHPNLYLVEPSKEGMTQTIAVDAVRDAVRFFSHTSGDGLPKCVIIDDADAMNRNAQNALLKMLEQPSGDGCFILVCHRLSALLPTVASRCRKIFLPNPSAEDCRRAIAPFTQDYAQQDVEATITLAGRSPGRTLELLESNGAEVYDAMQAALCASIQENRTEFSAAWARLVAAGAYAPENWRRTMYLAAGLTNALPDNVRDVYWRNYIDASRYTESIHLDKAAALRNVLEVAAG